eukprot:8963211-Ditylum_brightwellii.AAC.1
MKEDIQKKISELDEEIISRLKNEGYELAESEENQLFIEDTAGEGEVAFADNTKPMIDVDDIEYTPDAYDPYIGTEILISHGDKADRAK